MDAIAALDSGKSAFLRHHKPETGRQSADIYLTL